MKNLISASLILIVLSFCLAVSGMDYYVNAAKGLDTNTGTASDNAWKTITHALSKTAGTQDIPAVIYITAGVYDMTHGEIFPLKPKSFISLKGADKDTTIIDASGSAHSVFSISDREGLSFEGLTIAGGSGEIINDNIFGGGFFCLNTSIDILDCNIEGNEAQWGGGVYVVYSQLSLTYCYISQNKAHYSTGGVYLYRSTGTIKGCEFTRNSASQGGGLGCTYSSPEITDCIFKENQAELVEGYGGGYGAGIFVYTDSSPVISNCEFTNNTGFCGGGISCYASSPVITNCLIANNNGGFNAGENAGFGGGIFCGKNSDVAVDNCEIRDNKARLGGGLYCSEGSLTMSNCLVDGNTSEYVEGSITAGGGIYFEDILNSTITDCQFSNNSAPYGGAVAATGTGSILIESSLFDGNTAVRDKDYGGMGGAFHIEEGFKSEIKNCEIKNNTAISGGGINFYEASTSSIKDTVFENNTVEMVGDFGGGGGGICCSSCLSINIDGCTIKSNNALSGGGIYFNDSSSSIIDSLIENNTSARSGESGGFGGGIFSITSSHIINGCKVIGNKSYGGGGGLLFGDGNSSIVINCVISGNSTFYVGGDGSGGGIECDGDAETEIINCLIAENVTDKGGAFCFNLGAPKVINCTIYNNTATLGGAYYSYQGGNPEFTNCIIRQNDIDRDSAAIVTYSNIEGGCEGEGNIDEDPMFVTGPWGDYYLSCAAAGDGADSPSIDMGNPESIEGFKPADYITRCDGVVDSGRADMGYHYMPHIAFGVSIYPVKFGYKDGDTITVKIDLATAPLDTKADIYLIILAPGGNFYSAMSWNMGLQPLVSGFTAPADLDIEAAPLFNFTLPGTNPPVDTAGWYTIYLAALKPGTVDFISNIASTAFEVK